MKRLFLATLTFSLFLTSCAELTNADVGTVAGGVVGGILGNQIGGGAGRVAATAGGAMLGAFIGGNIGRTMDKVDRMQMQRALETAPVGRTVRWKNPDNGYSYAVRPVKTYYVHQQPCREYTTHAIIGGKSQEIYGKACRQGDGSWRVVN
jgi:surface antigen